MDLRRGSIFSGLRTVALVAVAALSLAACAATAASPPSRPTPTMVPASTSLRQSIDRLTGLTVQRTDAIPQNHMSFSFPAQVTITDPAQVQAVARALCALPKMPSGAFYGPADFGITYHLVFAAGQQRFRAISVDATGMQQVRGLGPTRWVARSPGFWQTLGVAMGLEHPNAATFSGSLPVSGQ